MSNINKYTVKKRLTEHIAEMPFGGSSDGGGCFCSWASTAGAYGPMYNYDKIEVYEGDVTGQWGLQSGRGFVIVHPDLDSDNRLLLMCREQEDIVMTVSASTGDRILFFCAMVCHRGDIDSFPPVLIASDLESAKKETGQWVTIENVVPSTLKSNFHILRIMQKTIQTID